MTIKLRTILIIGLMISAILLSGCEVNLTRGVSREECDLYNGTFTKVSKGAWSCTLENNSFIYVYNNSIIIQDCLNQTNGLVYGFTICNK